MNKNKEVEMPDAVQIRELIEKSEDRIVTQIGTQLNNLNEHITKLEGKFDTMQEHRTSDVERLKGIEMEYMALKEDLNEFKETEKGEGKKQHDAIIDIYNKHNTLSQKVYYISGGVVVITTVIIYLLKHFMG